MPPSKPVPKKRPVKKALKRPIKKPAKKPVKNLKKKRPKKPKKLHFQMRNLVVTVVDSNQQLSECPTYTCCSPPSGFPDQCEISALRPLPGISADDFERLIYALRDRMNAPETGVDIVIHRPTERGRKTISDRLEIMFGKPIRLPDLACDPNES